jgi:hypothetical protein
MTTDDRDQHIIRALHQQTYRAEARPEAAARLLDVARASQVAGRWEGQAWQKIYQGTVLKVSEDIEVPVPSDGAFFITVRMRFDIAEDHLITGEGELVFDFQPLGKDLTRTVYMDVDGAVLKDSRIAVELRNIMDDSRVAHISGTISTDGLTFAGTYQAFGMYTRMAVAGDFLLEKISEVPESCEMITGPQKPEALLDLIRQARRSILTTHFTPEIPTDAYISHMLEKLRNGVTITRIVAFQPDASRDVYRWLRYFRHPDGSALPHYQEYQFPGMPLPLDIIVVDDEIALQYFTAPAGARESSFAVCHYDSRVVRRLREYLTSLMEVPGQSHSAQTRPFQALPRYFYV